jgi:Predicted integral membrane protein (DUF2269)
MTLYSLMLFVHVTAAICLFIGFGILLFGITVIAHVARVEQVRTLGDLLLMVRLVVPASALLVIAAGLTMALTAWGLQTSWIAVALGSLVIIGPIGTWVIDPKVRAIATLARSQPDGPLPTELAERSHDPVLHLALHTITTMLFGIVFLMTSKPALTTAIGAMVVSALFGLASGILLVRARQKARLSRFDRHKEDAE